MSVTIRNPDSSLIGNTRVQDLELKELALHFFKQGSFTPEEAYEKAYSFLKIKRNCEGKDLMDTVEVGYRKLKIGDDVYYTLQINGGLHSVRLLFKNISANRVSEETALIGYVLKELEASGNGSKAVGGIKLVYSESMLINTNLSSQYNIVV
jgi:hypothetical protein